MEEKLVNKCNVDWKDVASTRPWDDASAQKITRLYVGLTRRAPDPEGLLYWVKAARTVDANPLATAFSAVDEPFKVTLSDNGKVSSRNLATKLYSASFGRAAEAAGVGYWTAELLKTGAESQTAQEYAAHPTSKLRMGEMINGFFAAAKGSDIAALENRVEAAKYFVARTVELGCPFSVELARDAIESVDQNSASFLDAKKRVDEGLQKIKKVGVPGPFIFQPPGLGASDSSGVNTVQTARVDQPASAVPVLLATLQCVPYPPTVCSGGCGSPGDAQCPSTWYRASGSISHANPAIGCVGGSKRLEQFDTYTRINGVLQVTGFQCWGTN